MSWIAYGLPLRAQHIIEKLANGQNSDNQSTHYFFLERNQYTHTHTIHISLKASKYILEITNYVRIDESSKERIMSFDKEKISNLIDYLASPILTRQEE